MIYSVKNRLLEQIMCGTIIPAASLINKIFELWILSFMPAHAHTCLAAQVRPEEVELVRRDYAANGGWETFLAYEDPRHDILVGLLRLRKVSGSVLEAGAATGAQQAPQGGRAEAAGQHLNPVLSSLPHPMHCYQSNNPNKLPSITRPW